MKLIIKYFSKYKAQYFLALFFLTIEALSDLLQPTIMSFIVDKGVKTNDFNYVLTMIILMLVVTIIGAFSAMIRNFLASTVSQKFTSEIRLDVYTKVHKLSFEAIDGLEQGSLITRLTNDMTQVQQFSYGIMRIFVKAPITCIGAVVMMFILDNRMGLILLGIIPIAILLIFLNMKIGFPFFMKVQKALDKLNTKMREYLSGVRVVKAFNRFKYEENRFQTVNQELSDTTTKTMRVMAIFNPGISLTVNLGLVLILYIGGYQVYNGTLEVGKIMAFVMYMTQILHSLSLMSNIFNMYIRANASSKRINEIMESSEAPSTLFLNDAIVDERTSVEFKDVSFSYQGNALPVLKNISFTANLGQMIGIIGPTGSGKTTLLNLMLRFYDVSKGIILINGMDIKDYDIECLRKDIAIVPQKNILFSGSIYNNILFGNLTATDKDIKKAAEIACIHSFIEKLPNGYETMLGQGGVNLSGGQKQRLCIARGLVRSPKILILDDCTSAVDVHTENHIKAGIKEFSQDIICFMVSQRISSIMNCDQIIVMDNGEVTGIGQHKELLESCEIYQDIYRSQIGQVGDSNE